MKPSIELVRQYWAYDPLTGILTRKIRLRGDIPITLNPKRTRVDFLGIRYTVTHLIWAIHFGKWPDEIIDHEDHGRTNTKLTNLREADKWQNMWNRKERNPLGKGVTMKAGKYHAQIQFKGVKKHLGDHDTAEQAAKAYEKAAIELFGEFACVE